MQGRTMVGETRRYCGGRGQSWSVLSDVSSIAMLILTKRLRWPYCCCDDEETDVMTASLFVFEDDRRERCTGRCTSS